MTCKHFIFVFQYLDWFIMKTGHLNRPSISYSLYPPHGHKQDGFWLELLFECKQKVFDSGCNGLFPLLCVFLYTKQVIKKTALHLEVLSQAAKHVCEELFMCVCLDKL